MRHARAIRRALLEWYRRAARPLPWRRTQDPYRIWVSEIMLQQTRVATVVPYYRRFLRTFPNVRRLAEASEDDLLRVWSGLGYYQRARNMQRAARRVLELGRFPEDYEAIRSLPGVGDYTAAAIASIAFGKPYVALDGNGIRVLARILGERSRVRSAAVRARLRRAAERLLDRAHPGDFNQALMELGATVCVPRTPDCPECPLARWCEGRRLGIERQLPAGSRRPNAENVTRTLLVVQRDGALLLKRRPAGGQLEGFLDLPEPADLPGARLGPKLAEFRHSILHRRYLVTLRAAESCSAPGCLSWIPHEKLGQVPLTTWTRKALAALRRRPG